MILWVIGSGGLFGSAVVRAAQSQDWPIFEGSSIPWNDPHQAISVIRADAARLAHSLRNDQSWGIVWAAGRATTASTQAEADGELSLFTRAVDAIRVELDTHGNGAFLLASSAGAVYAGSENPPFDSNTTPKPIGIYGDLKRQQEITAEQVLGKRMQVVVARIANLYGPGQDLGKLQGLISRIALAAINKHPLMMFVPLDTLRDYIYVDDAAHWALHWITTASRTLNVRIVASGSVTNLGYIINQMKQITRTQIPIAYGAHPSAAVQARDLRLIPDTSAEPTTVTTTSLPAGMKVVYTDILLRHQDGRQAPAGGLLRGLLHT